MARFKILQITDLHISVPPDGDIGELALWMSMQAIYPSRARQPVLNAVADFVVSRQSDIDAVLISGDLADDGLMYNLYAARDFLEEPAFAAGAMFNLANLMVIGFLVARQARQSRLPAVSHA